MLLVFDLDVKFATFFSFSCSLQCCLQSKMRAAHLQNAKTITLDGLTPRWKVKKDDSVLVNGQAFVRVFQQMTCFIDQFAELEYECPASCMVTMIV